MNEKEIKDIPEVHQKTNVFGHVASFFVDRYKMAYLLIVAVVLVGFMAYIIMPRESMPEVVVPVAVVTTAYPGATPEDVETLVTDKIESKISELDDVDSVDSVSSLGYSQITIQFNSGIDMDQKGILLSNKVNEIIFPSGVQDSNVRVFATSDTPLMKISILGDYSSVELSSIAEHVQTLVEGVSGVGEVEINGEVERRIIVRVNPAKLSGYGLTVNAIENAIRNSNVNMPVGDGNFSGSYYNIRVDETFASLDEIENIAVKNNDGEMLFLKDVVEIIDGTKEVRELNRMYISEAEQSQKTLSSVMLSVKREDGSDVVGTSKKVKDLLEKSKGQEVPADVTFHISGDQAKDVSKDLSDVLGNALSGLFVVIIVLFLFIGFRESVIVSGIIPLTMLATLATMYYWGLTLNSLTLLALIISLGLLVDNAIVVMENVDRLRHEGLSVIEAAKKGTNQVGPSIFASSLTTIAAFLPLANMDGTMGEFIRVIPLAIIFAIGISFLFSIVITPTLCARHIEEHRHPFMERAIVRWASVLLIALLSYISFNTGSTIGLLQVVAAVVFGGAMWMKQFRFKGKRLEESAFVIKYKKIMDGLIASRKRQVALLGCGVLVFVFSLSMIPLGVLKTNFMPSSDPIAFTIDIKTPQGMTLDSTNKIVVSVEEQLFKIKAIKDFSTTIGGNVTNAASININIVDDGTVNGNEVKEQIRQQLKTISGAEFQVIAQSDGRPGGSSRPVAISLKGNNTQTLKKAADTYLQIMKNIPGILEPALGSDEGAPQLKVDINKNKAANLGLNPSGIASDLRRYISGSTVTQFTNNGEEVDVVLQIDSERRETVEQIGQLPLNLVDGSVIPVSAVAEIKEVRGISEIKHEDYETTMSVEADLESGYNLNQVLTQFEDAAASVPIDDSVTMSYGGDRMQMEDSFASLGMSLAIAAMLVFIILAVQFNSIRLPIIVVMTLPMAAIGVVWGLIITGNDFGFYAFMGMVALVGIAVNNAIVLVDYTNYLRKTGSALSEAVVKAGVSRFSPVLATTITTIGGLLPLSMKDPYYGQLGFTLIFGLMVSTVMTLVYVPILYKIAEDFSRKKGEQADAQA